jgi:hypothetical protein
VNQSALNATVDTIREHISKRIQTLGNKTHGPQYSEAEKLRAAHGVRELVKLQNWIESRIDIKGN